MEERKIETVKADEVISPDANLDKNGNLIIRDKEGRFPKGVSGNPSGRKKGSGFADVIAKVFEEASANGITYEDFVKKMIIKAYTENDAIAMRFILEKTPKPRSVIEVGTTQAFELYDLSQESVDDGEEGDSDGDTS